ncbi:MAG TPA: hypothetical protein VK610_01950 [Rhodothermales bacterium]|nr:hypothetical protein [Rhodothermales bacterium]
MSPPLPPRQSRTLVLVIFGVAVLLAVLATVFIKRAWENPAFQDRVRETRQERGERV